MSGHLFDRYSTHEVICESFDHWRQLALLPLVQASGRLSKVSGTTIEAEGLYAPIGAQCAIESAALKKVDVLCRYRRTQPWRQSACGYQSVAGAVR